MLSQFPREASEKGKNQKPDRPWAPIWMARVFTRRFSWEHNCRPVVSSRAIDGGNASAGGVNPEMRDPTADRERRRRENRRFILTFGGLILAVTANICDVIDGDGVVVWPPPGGTPCLHDFPAGFERQIAVRATGKHGDWHTAFARRSVRSRSSCGIAGEVT